MPDVVIIGGGVIGLTVAYELAGQGARVTLLEQGQFGREASWAGAGILPPGNRKVAVEPLARLRAESHALWPKLSAELQEQTGIDNGFRNCGGLELGESEGAEGEIEQLAAEWRREGVEAHSLSGRSLREFAPALAPGFATAVHLPEMCQVRNPRHLKALVAGCAQRGVELVAGAPVSLIERLGNDAVEIYSPGRRVRAAMCCVTAGAWTAQLLAMANLGFAPAIFPVRGQIVQLSMQPLPFRQVIEQGARYLVPRPDGRILIGSTEEHAGFDKRNTAAAVAELIEFGCRLVPALRNAKFEQAWAGLRPGSPASQPFLDRLPEAENVFVAAGHFRAGLQLSPATGLLMRQLILGQELAMPLEGFGCQC